MPDRSAKEILREHMFSALVESVNALRKGNVDQAVLREVKAIHGNTTFKDLPDNVQTALNRTVDATLIKLLAEGYTISAKS